MLWIYKSIMLGLCNSQEESVCLSDIRKATWLKEEKYNLIVKNNISEPSNITSAWDTTLSDLSWILCITHYGYSSLTKISFTTSLLKMLGDLVVKKQSCFDLQSLCSWVNIDDWPCDQGFTHIKRGHPMFGLAMSKIFYISGQIVNH